MRAPIPEGDVPRLKHCDWMGNCGEDVLDDQAQSNRPLRAARAHQKDCDRTLAALQSSSEVFQPCNKSLLLAHDAGDDQRMMADVATSDLGIVCSELLQSMMTSARKSAWYLWIARSMLFQPLHFFCCQVFQGKPKS